jgi:Arc/MetJ-type ribon-helix-helix transcriptional regulator
MKHGNKAETGRYNSGSKVVREPSRLFEERDRIRQLQIQELRKKANKGCASLERGERVDGEEFSRALGREEREGKACNIVEGTFSPEDYAEGIR